MLPNGISLRKEEKTMPTRSVARAENVGSLLQPDRLLQARKSQQEGVIALEQLRAIEDDAVLEIIALQEGVGLDRITDGELRRSGWADTARHLDGLDQRPGARSYPANVRLMAGGINAPASGQGQGGGQGAGFLTVVGKISPKKSEPVGQEYPFLHAHAKSPTKYTMAAPSYHRRYWSDEISPKESGYSSCEEFLTDVRDWLHNVAAGLAAGGCTYIQLDAPNYGSLCDPDNRSFHSEQGHDIPAELAFDAALDSSLFEGLDVTSALHICRGNTPGGRWHSQGGYAAIAEDMFPHLDVDVALLEYDSERAGDFSPISYLKPGTIAVLGLLTTKEATLESPSELEARIEEATNYIELEDLALSTQCGFASAANAPMTFDEQRAKLELVTTSARRIWS
jgi:5-methyltetrahydropteroyltriglutamate--homocysteine methyltransferase